MAAGQERAPIRPCACQSRRQAILRAAVLTFARYGYRNTSMSAGAHGPHMKEFAMPAGKYGAPTTAAEVIRDVDMHGRRVLVTYDQWTSYDGQSKSAIVRFVVDAAQRCRRRHHAERTNTTAVDRFW